MSDDFLKFANPAIGSDEIAEVLACLQSGWLATGPRVQQFEQELSQYWGGAQVAVLNSATAGLHLALKSFGIVPGDEVITTPMTFIASLNAIVHAGAKPVLVDVDLATRNIDINQIEAAITPKTRAILPVHFAGIPVDLDAIYALAQRHQLRVVEDAAHAMGSHYKSKMIGSFGDTQVFSFHPNKIMTSGEGGGVATRDSEMIREIKVQRFHGIDREAWNRYGKGGSQHYDVIQPGYKYNMMDLQAAIGLHQLRRLEQFIHHRQQLVDRYQQLLAGWPELSLPALPSYDCRVSWYIYAPLLNLEAAGMNRDQFIARMAEHNIGVGYHHHAAHLYSYYRDTYGYQAGDFPNAETISERIFSLPLFSEMTFAEQDRVIAAMSQIWNRR